MLMDAEATTLTSNVETLHRAYQEYCCQCDETSMSDQFLVVESTEGCYVHFKGDPDP